MTEENKAPNIWVIVPIAGMDVTFLEPTEDQYMVIRRLERKLARETSDVKAQERAAILLLDALSYLMETDEMRDHVDDAVLRRNLQLGEFLNLLAGALAQKDEAEGQVRKPAKKATKAVRARRG